MKRRTGTKGSLAVLLMLTITSCVHRRPSPTFHDPGMDFGLLQSVAVMPFANLTPNPNASPRVAEVFSTMLQAAGTIYVQPPGEVNQAVSRQKVTNPQAPTPEEVVSLAKALKTDAVFTGTVLEYGEIRSGSASANVISLSLKMMEGQTGRVVWTSSASRGGIGAGSRLFGGGGKPMDEVTQEAVDALLDELFGN